jgi:hypothetical protein
VKWKNKLEIGDACISILSNREAGYRELVIGYKQIHVNVYCVKVIDISVKKKTQATVFRHESFQLWESETMGFIIHKNKDFMMLNSNGISVLGLGDQEKRVVMDDQGNMRMIHAL